jgi:hypothetical protein
VLQLEPLLPLHQRPHALRTGQPQPSQHRPSKNQNHIKNSERKREFRINSNELIPNNKRRVIVSTEIDQFVPIARPRTQRKGHRGHRTVGGRQGERSDQPIRVGSTSIHLSVSSGGDETHGVICLSGDDRAGKKWRSEST